MAANKITCNAITTGFPGSGRVFFHGPVYGCVMMEFGIETVYLRNFEIEGMSIPAEIIISECSEIRHVGDQIVFVWDGRDIKCNYDKYPTFQLSDSISVTHDEAALLIRSGKNRERIEKINSGWISCGESKDCGFVPCSELRNTVFNILKGKFGAKLQLNNGAIIFETGGDVPDYTQWWELKIAN